MNIEKCYKEEKIIKNEIAFIRPDLTREVIKVSFGIRYFLASGKIEEEYYDVVYKESLQDGYSYYPNQECNSYEEIQNISLIAAKRDQKFNELVAGLKK
jgi:hypothetical protein